MIFSPQRDLVIRASKSQDYRIKHIANPVITTNTIPKKEKQTMKKYKTKKTERIFLRLSPSEKKVIQENALTTGMNTSDYIRESVLQKFPQSSVPTINVLEVITHISKYARHFTRIIGQLFKRNFQRCLIKYLKFLIQ